MIGVFLMGYIAIIGTLDLDHQVISSIYQVLLFI